VTGRDKEGDESRWAPGVVQWLGYHALILARKIREDRGSIPRLGAERFLPLRIFARYGDARVSGPAALARWHLVDDGPERLLAPALDVAGELFGGGAVVETTGTARCLLRLGAQGSRLLHRDALARQPVPT
jgi:hypothetical protein